MVKSGPFPPSVESPLGRRKDQRVSPASYDSRSQRRAGPARRARPPPRTEPRGLPLPGSQEGGHPPHPADPDEGPRPQGASHAAVREDAGEGPVRRADPDPRPQARRHRDLAPPLGAQGQGRLRLEHRRPGVRALPAGGRPGRLRRRPDDAPPAGADHVGGLDERDRGPEGPDRGLNERKRGLAGPDPALDEGERGLEGSPTAAGLPARSPRPGLRTRTRAPGAAARRARSAPAPRSPKRIPAGPANAWPRGRAGGDAPGSP